MWEVQTTSINHFHEKTSNSRCRPPTNIIHMWFGIFVFVVVLFTRSRYIQQIFCRTNLCNGIVPEVKNMSKTSRRNKAPSWLVEVFLSWWVRAAGGVPREKKVLNFRVRTDRNLEKNLTPMAFFDYYQSFNVVNLWQ